MKNNNGSKANNTSTNNKESNRIQKNVPLDNEDTNVSGLPGEIVTPAPFIATPMFPPEIPINEVK